MENNKQPLLTHLMALRKLLVVSVLSIAGAFVIAFYFFSNSLMTFITRPILAKGVQIIYTAVSEAMMTQMKVSLIAGILLASPVVVWQIWSFMKPALYPHEKRLFRALFFVCVLLFVLGVVFCYYYVYNLAVDFFLVSGENIATPMLSIDKYVDFQFSFLLPFGFAFELPVVIFMLAKRGKVNYQKLCKSRKYVLLVLSVFAAIMTPPDVVSQIMLLVPMYLLFEISIQVSRLVKPAKQT